MIDVNLTVDDGAEARLQVEDGQEVALSIESSYSSGLPDYTGPTSVTPSTSAQELATAETSVHSNIMVGAIPPEYVVPTGTYAVTGSGTHDVKTYASASVPAGSATVANQSFTANPTIQVDGSGQVTASVSGSKTVAPTVSAGWVASGASGTVSVSGASTQQVPSGTEGTPTAAKGAVSNHAVDVTPSVTNSAGWIAGGTHTGTAVSVSASELVSGTKPIENFGTIDVTNYASASVAEGEVYAPTATKGAVQNHSVSITPHVAWDEGFMVANSKNGTPVSVTASELVSGTKSIAANGTGIDVTDYASVDVAVPIPTPSMQSKSKNYTPTESAQSETVSADSGYDGLSSVDVSVAAVSSTYVGSGITRRDSTDLSASGATVSVPAGYYENAASKAVASGSATVPSTINAGNGASISYGLTNITLSKANVSITPTVTPGYVSSGTAGNATVYLSATADFQPETTFHPSTSDQTILAGKITQGVQRFKAVTMTNLDAGNIKDGVTVKIGDSTDDDCVTSVTGTYTGGSVTVNPLSVTTNGTYTAPTGPAYSPVTVSVSGSDHMTKIATKSLGTISTTNTSATDTGQTLEVTGFDAYDMLVAICHTSPHTNGRNVASVRLINFSATSTAGTKTATQIATSTQHWKLSSGGTMQMRSGTTAYGVYVNAATLDANSNPRKITLTIYQRYNSTSSGTINGSYVLDVYGVKLQDLL